VVLVFVLGAGEPHTDCAIEGKPSPHRQLLHYPAFFLAGVKNTVYGCVKNNLEYFLRLEREVLALPHSSPGLPVQEYEQPSNSGSKDNPLGRPVSHQHCCGEGGEESE